MKQTKQNHKKALFLAFIAGFCISKASDTFTPQQLQMKAQQLKNLETMFFQQNPFESLSVSNKEKQVIAQWNNLVMSAIQALPQNKQSTAIIYQTSQIINDILADKDMRKIPALQRSLQNLQAINEPGEVVHLLQERLFSMGQMIMRSARSVA